MDQDLGREHGVVLPVRVGRGGADGPSRREASGPDWRKSSHGLYVPAYVDLTPEQRIAEAGVLLSAYSAITGWGALCWLGGSWFTGTYADGVSPRPVPLAQSRHRIRPQPHLQLCEERFDEREVIVVDGLRITNPARSVCFAMRYARDVEDAIRTLDMAYFDDLVTPAEVRDWAGRHASFTGIDQCRRAPDHADENAWSPPEVDQRLDWTRVTGRRPLTNRPIFDLAGRHLGTPDLVDPVAGVVGQYDSGLHLPGQRRAADLRRDQAYRAHGLETVVMVTADRREPDYYHQRLRAAYRDAARRTAEERSFTLDLPPWWRPTFTVAQRRALSDADRARWLKRGAPQAG